MSNKGRIAGSSGSRWLRQEEEPEKLFMGRQKKRQVCATAELKDQRA
jgi:hypothetical protein